MTAKIVMCDGDSITAGHDIDPSNTWPSVVARMSYFAEKTVHNVAVSGSKIQDLIDRYPTKVGIYSPVNTGDDEAMLIAPIGINNIHAGHSVDTMIGQLETYWDMALSDGFEVIGCTIPPNGADAKALQIVRQEFNSRIIYSPKWRRLALLDALLPDANNTVYFQDDKLHLKEAGMWQIARYMNITLPQGGAQPVQPAAYQQRLGQFIVGQLGVGGVPTSAAHIYGNESALRLQAIDSNHAVYMQCTNESGGSNVGVMGDEDHLPFAGALPYAAVHVSGPNNRSLQAGTAGTCHVRIDENGNVS